MRPLSFAALFSLISLSQAAVTLYVVEQPEEANTRPTLQVEATTLGISAIGVNEEGATTYVQEVVYGLMVMSGLVSDAPLTVNSVPMTRLFTFVEDADGYSASAEGSGIFAGDSEVCEFGDDGTGTCVEVFELGNPLTTFTSTTTYSGPLSAWHTIGDDSNTNPPAPSETGEAEDSDGGAEVVNALGGGRIAAFILTVGGCIWLGL